MIHASLNKQKIIEREVLKLQEFKRPVLFARSEVNDLVDTCKTLECNITNSTNDKGAEYNKYIEFLHAIVQYIKLKQQNMRYQQRMEVGILIQAQKLCETAMKEYPESIDVEVFKIYQNLYSQSQVEFTKLIEKNLSSRMKQFPKACLAIAHWHRVNKKFNLAQYSLKLGHSSHPEDQNLLKAYFELELEMMMLLNGPSQDLNKRLVVQLEKSAKYINEAQFYIDLLTILWPYKCTIPTQMFLCEYLLSQHSKNNLVWDCFAQRYRNILEFPRSLFNEPKNANSLISETIRVYKRGLNEVSNDNLQCLWILYIDYLIDIEKAYPAQENLIMKELFQAFKLMDELGFLQPKYYIKWLDYVTYESAGEYLDLGIRSCPDSVILWKHRLQYEILQEKPNNIQLDTIFNRGVETLGDESLPLWLIKYRRLISVSSNDAIETFLNIAIQQSPSISHTMRMKYLEWSCLERGIEKTLQIYHRFEIHKDYYNKMHDLLEAHLSFTVDQLEPVETFHNSSVNSFQSDMDVHINFLKFYVCNKMNRKQLTISIYKRAEEALDCDTFKKFVEEYNKIVAQIEQ